MSPLARDVSCPCPCYVSIPATCLRARRQRWSLPECRLWLDDTIKPVLGHLIPDWKGHRRVTQRHLAGLNRSRIFWLASAVYTGLTPEQVLCVLSLSWQNAGMDTYPQPTQLAWCTTRFNWHATACLHLLQTELGLWGYSQHKIYPCGDSERTGISYNGCAEFSPAGYLPFPLSGHSANFL